MSDIKILGKNVNITFSEEGGKYIYQGISEDKDTFYSKVIYDPSTSSFSYIQVLNAELKFDGGDRSRIDVIAGNDIKVKDDGTIQGIVRHYFIQKYNDSDTYELGIGDGEYFSGSAGSGTIFKDFSNINNKDDAISPLFDIQIDEIEDFEEVAKEIQSLGDKNYTTNQNKYRGMIWYTFDSKEIFTKGQDFNDSFEEENIFEEVKKLATEYSDSEWVLSDPEDVNYN